MTDPITVVAATSLTKPVVETALSLLKDLLGEPFKVAGGLLADEVYAWRWRNRIRIVERAARHLQGKHVDPRVLPPGFLMPLLETCGDADDDDLQELWSRLLAGAVADDSHAHPLLVEALKGLNGDDARYLASIFHVGVGPVRGRLPRDVRHYVGRPVPEPHDQRARRSWERLLAKGVLGREISSDLERWGRQITSVLDGSTGGRIPSRLDEGEPFRTEVVLTHFGAQLVDALGLVPQALAEHGQVD